MEDTVRAKRAGSPWWDPVRAAWLACERLAERAPLRFSLLAILVLMVSSIAAFQISYDEPDDMFMTMVVAGKGFCPAPDEHMIFSNVLVGHTLKRLYTAWPMIPWYGCYLLSVHFAAQVALLYCALTIPCRGLQSDDATRGLRRRLALYAVYFAVVELAFLNNLQFTTTAFLAAQAGVFLFLLVVRRRAHQAGAPVILPLCAAVTLLVVASLVRLESLAMALLVMAPVGLLLVRDVSRRIVVPCGVAAGLAAVLISLGGNYDRTVYAQDPQWSGFFHYNQLRVRFNDYLWTSYTPQTAGVFSAVGWSENDHEMISHWFFDDPRLYSEAQLSSILESYPWRTARLTPAYFKEVCRRLLQDRAVWSVLLVLPFFLVSIDRDRSARWAVIGCAVMGLALVGFLILYFKLPPKRTYFPMLSLPLAAALLFPAGSKDSRSRGAGSVRGEEEWEGLDRSVRVPSALAPPMPRAVFVMLMVGLVMGVYHQCRRSAHAHRDRQALEAFLADVRPGDEKLYVSWEGTLPFHLVSPLDNLTAWPRVPMLTLSWMQQTPWHQEIKRQFGISNLAQALYERDDIVLIATPTHRSLFVTFAKEHFAADVEFVPSAGAGEKITAGRFERRTQGGETAEASTDALKR